MPFIFMYRTADIIVLFRSLYSAKIYISCSVHKYEWLKERVGGILYSSIFGILRPPPSCQPPKKCNCVFFKNKKKTYSHLRKSFTEKKEAENIQISKIIYNCMYWFLKWINGPWWNNTYIENIAIIQIQGVLDKMCNLIYKSISIN